MIIRTIQTQNGSYFTIIPKTFADVLGIKAGSKVSFEMTNKKIIITPATAAKQETGIASPSSVNEGVADDNIFSEV